SAIMGSRRPEEAIPPASGLLTPGSWMLMFRRMLMPVPGYWATATMASSGFVGESPLFLLDYLLRFARVAVLLAVWRTILDGKGATFGMTLGAVLTYTLVAEVFAEPLSGRTEL